MGDCQTPQLSQPSLVWESQTCRSGANVSFQLGHRPAVLCIFEHSRACSSMMPASSPAPFAGAATFPNSHPVPSSRAPSVQSQILSRDPFHPKHAAIIRLKVTNFVPCFVLSLHRDFDRGPSLVASRWIVVDHPRHACNSSSGTGSVAKSMFSPLRFGVHLAYVRWCVWRARKAHHLAARSQMSAR